MSKLLTLIYMFIGVYCTVAGVKKVGIFYNNPTVREDRKEPFTKDMSLFLRLGGPILTLGAVLEMTVGNSIYYMTCYVAVIALAMLLMFRMRKYTCGGCK